MEIDVFLSVTAKDMRMPCLSHSLYFCRLLENDLQHFIKGAFF